MIDFVAEAQTRVIKPSGEETLETIGVSRPERQETGEYGCVVSLPDSSELREIYGEDALQSLSLALRFVADRIEGLLAEGWEFYFGDSDDRFPFEAYFLPIAWTQKLESVARQAGRDRGIARNDESC